MSDTQQVCPHCGKQIEPHYYAYDKPVDTHWLDQAIAQAAEQLEKRINQVPMTPLSDEQIQELKRQIAEEKRPVHLHYEYLDSKEQA